MRIYQRQEDDLWVIVWGAHYQNKQVASTEMEALEMAEKIEFVEKLRSLVDTIGAVMDAEGDVYQLYFDRGYNGGGADPIVDGDITSTGLTAAEVTSAITLLENLVAFFNGTSPVNAQYRVTVNSVRRL